MRNNRQHHHHVFLVVLLATTALTFHSCNALATTPKPTSPAAAAAAAVVVPPDLVQLAPRLYGTKLNYRVAFGDKEAPFQIKDLHIELGSNCQTAKPSTKKSSSAASLATGIHDANILQNPYYVNDQGQQTVLLQNGGWQVQWSPKSSPHGFLVCSFVSTSDYQRNSNNNDTNIGSKSKNSDKSSDYSKLDKGVRFFIYHRIWTRATLASERARRRAIQITAAKAIRERDLKVEQMTNNNEKDENGNNKNGGALSKVTAYAQAAKSMKDYRESGIKEAMYIPLHDYQVLELSTMPDCIVSSRGLVYKMTAGGVGRRGGLEYMGESRVDL